MSEFVTCLECSKCGKTYPKNEAHYSCLECNGFLDVVFDLAAMRDRLVRHDFDCRSPLIMERWVEFLPIDSPALIQSVSLGEMITPMLKANRLGKKLGLNNLWFKNEASFPTGSLKDRSMPLVVIKALEFGFDTVSIVSSGNAAASLSAYAARAGLKAVVFVAGGSPARLLKCRAYGSYVVNVTAPYSEVEAMYLSARDQYGWYDCNGLINPFRLEGKKTLAHEIAQFLGWQAPDMVILPTAFGNGLVSAYKGFQELQSLGWTDSLPHMFAVQPEVCAPIAEAYDSGRTEVLPVKPGVTVATSIAVGNPSIGGARVLAVARNSGGGVVGVSEELISIAQALLARDEGIFVEPAGATGLAAVIKLKEEGKIFRDTTIVTTTTGAGVNDVESAAKWARELHTVDPASGSLQALLEQLSRNVVVGGR